ncbi:tektin-4 [Parasteatoda tepidariorum]|uniref:tektin-4 n=1 Tax=Parasteatoda tepidariorum TaxID=114398 RepID=UPI001C7245B2|nr:tektin-4 [Parasteatoda tepidariorum]
MNPSTPQILSIDEWYKNNQRRFNQSDVTRAEWFRINQQSKQLAKEKKILTDTLQDAVTKKIADRAKDIFDCQKDLEKTIEDLTVEIKKLHMEKKRLENSLNESQLSLIVAQESLDLRDQRISSDLVHDKVQDELHREIEIIQMYQDLTKMIIGEIENQIKRDQQSKVELERDWSDKWEAYNIDTICAHMNNTSSEQIAFYTGPQKIPNKWSSPQDWIEFTRHRLFYARDEIRTSGILRDKINSHLMNGYRDLRHQADMVESALARRVNETADSLYRLKKHLEMIMGDIAEAEKLITFLKKQILEKEAPLKKVQTRLHLRNERPNVELCEDKAHLGLITESRELAATIQSLQEQLARAEASLSNLQETRRDLEREIAIKENSMTVDKGRVQGVRKKFPAQHKLLGH